MAEPKVVRGTLGGVTVQVSEEVANLLGGAFEPEKTPAKKTAASSKSEK